MSKSNTLQTATLAGGCFWCLEAVYDLMEGVVSVESGYSGGRTPHPTYEQVCSGATGHAEVVRITFDPACVSYRELLEVFFSIHDPTTLNRQGADLGTQYRSAIFFHDAEQKRIAEDLIREKEASCTWKDPVVTEVAPFTDFYRAEDYHQEYLARHGLQPYCRAIIAPKLAKFQKAFSLSLRERGRG